MTIPHFSIRITLLADGSPVSNHTIPYARPLIPNHEAIRAALDSCNSVSSAIASFLAKPTPESRRDAQGLTAADWGVPEKE